tara:strand:- start:2144 stop:2482 length:339 start_codon:yes stop_codon:yes gene_type:complete
MKIFKLSEMKKGWFIGDFKPTAFSTKEFEVNYRTHKAGSNWEMHYHCETTEINLIVKGKMKFNDIILKEEDIFIVEPWQISDPEFLEDTTVICVRTPSRYDKKVVMRIDENK